jgi:beta-lactamase class A
MGSLRDITWIVLFLVVTGVASLPSQEPSLSEDRALERQLLTVVRAHRGQVALYAENLRSGRTAGLRADQAVKTASVIKMGILLDAAEQIRAGRVSLNEKLELNKEDQVPGSGVLGQLTPPITLSLRDVLELMVVVSDNTATNMAIDRLGLEHINATLRAAQLDETVLYKRVLLPADRPMPADQPQFGLGKTTPRQMASIMKRFAQCRLALDGSAPVRSDGPLCATILGMLRGQHDRDSLPRYLEALDTGGHGSAIANKTGALNQVRNDVALVATNDGPIVIAAFTWDNADQRWTGDNEPEKMLGRLAQNIVSSWAPKGLNANSFPWSDPLAGPR